MTSILRGTGQEIWRTSQRFNRAAGKLRRDMQAFRNRCWEFTISNMADPSDDGTSVYRLPSIMTGKRRRRPHLPAIVGPFGQPLSKPEEKFEYIAVCLERQFVPNPLNDWDFEEDLADETEEQLRKPINAEPELTSVEEVTERLLALQPQKAPGSNGVSNAALSSLPGRGINFLLGLFNACL